MSILVWRIWNVNYIGPLVTSRAYSLRGQYGIPWYPGEIQKAACSLVMPLELVSKPTSLHRISDTPATHCRCGIYGYKNASVPQRFPLLTTFMTTARLEVIGIAEIWGKIIVAEYGYRAEYAQMRALVGNPKIAQDFGVPHLPTMEYARREYF